jgi:hypothetical protein
MGKIVILKFKEILKDKNNLPNLNMMSKEKGYNRKLTLSNKITV